MYKIQGVIPIAQKDPNGVEFTEECIRKLETTETPIIDLIKKKQGRGYKQLSQIVGSCRMALRRKVLIFDGQMEVEPQDKPYLRLTYSYIGNQIDPSSIKLILSDQPGILTESNYKLY